MDWSESIENALPPPRLDEPSSLRDDIADELRDHLGCAFAQALRKADDEVAARESVLSRFGDPTQLARQLWFDSMKEKIMNRRLTIFAIAAPTLICIAALAFSWTRAQRAQAMAQRALAESQRAMATAVAELRKQQSAEPALDPMEWVHVKLRLVKGAEDGPAIRNVPVKLRGRLFLKERDAHYDELSAVSDEEGDVRFGPVRPGRYFLHVDFDGEQTLPGIVVIRALPGKDVDQTLVCPDPRTGKVRFEVEWPEALDRDQYWLGVLLRMPRFDSPQGDVVEASWIEAAVSDEEEAVYEEAPHLVQPDDYLQMYLLDANGNCVAGKSYAPPLATEAWDPDIAVSSGQSTSYFERHDPPIRHATVRIGHCEIAALAVIQAVSRSVSDTVPATLLHPRRELARESFRKQPLASFDVGLDAPQTVTLTVPDALVEKAIAANKPKRDD